MTKELYLEDGFWFLKNNLHGDFTQKDPAFIKELSYNYVIYERETYTYIPKGSVHLVCNKDELLGIEMRLDRGGQYIKLEANDVGDIMYSAILKDTGLTIEDIKLYEKSNNKGLPVLSFRFYESSDWIDYLGKKSIEKISASKEPDSDFIKGYNAAINNACYWVSNTTVESGTVQLEISSDIVTATIKK